MTTAAQLDQLLKQSLSAFGFSSFRTNQESVCRATITGKDVLLVMPTGSGKSLCYQLPGIARGGTTLVISPLIALMDDQAAKLAAQGFSVARIHSGLDRNTSRQACIDYLNGTLQFLFIAPERLRVPNFPEMLGKRKPTLIAIDEAHCISQWGHDFRPDYRMLGQYLPMLRPAPVIALTATATPTVQQDILTQLGIKDSAKFIHGFRRNNLGIEVVEIPLPQRPDRVAEILHDPQRLPAIIYAPTRKHAETLAAQLSRQIPAAAYHAGLEPEIRENVQQRFLAGQLTVVVATIAFGMGIDKANVRTVIHTALPATLEGYYQEIGRAGRDGLPSRTILMHSYADQRTHDFFMNRDYPPVSDLTTIFNRLTDDPEPSAEVYAKTKLTQETFDKALEKLLIHRAAEMDYDGNVRRGSNQKWQSQYAAQSDQRRKQIDLVQRFTQSNICRMAALVRHFGDVEDSSRPCGVCDVCAPQNCLVQQFRNLTPREEEIAHSILEALRTTPEMATGRLQRDLPMVSTLNRNDFESLLAALVQAGLVELESAEFEKNGETIAYRKASLTDAGYQVRPHSSLAVSIKAASNDDAPKSRSRKSSTGSKNSGTLSASASEKNTPKERQPLTEISGASKVLEDRLKTWRQQLARKQGIPPFIILHDQSLREIALNRPHTPNALEAIPGIGPTKIEKYGTEILSLCAESI